MSNREYGFYHTTAAARRRDRVSARASIYLTLAAAVITFFSILTAPADAFAQRRFDKEYPAGRNVRLHLTNRFGMITVEAWKNNRIKITAEMESSAVRLTPQPSEEGLVIDLVRDNREDVGYVNFRIQVPVNTTVDVTTKQGNITVRGVQGEMVRARVSLEGDIELTGIRSPKVIAESLMGSILFDAELLRGGVYHLTSMQGDINLRIGADSGFRLTATAPRTRHIDLGRFARMGDFQFLSERRRVVGQVGEGGAALSTTNQRGSIVFISR